ncbi:RsfA family transcriptional regulator [Priestia koreensis]|uniref:RsfA family transcriptional regulator n=1 Tax=Priestia koreensis TaxID=284581 RepID=UPI001F59C92E|nr:RsfA family transcriptional regulator [Priestia koreensis]UNL84921.1 RsfA family transcriptional regulator [Priestia koreensis]
MKERQDAWTEENDLLLAETVLRHVREGSTQLNAFEEVGDQLNRTSAACGFRWNAVVRHQYEKALQLAKKQRKQRMRALGQTNGKKKLLYNPPVSLLNQLDHIDDLDSLEEEMIQSTVSATLPVSAEDYVEEEIAPKVELPAVTVAPTATASKPSSGLSLDQVILFLQSMRSKNLNSEIFKNQNHQLMRENEELRMKNKELVKRVEELEANTTTIQEDYETLMKIMNRARNFVLFDEEDRATTKFKMDRNGNLEKLAE